MASEGRYVYFLTLPLETSLSEVIEFWKFPDAGENKRVEMSANFKLL